jgi:hypothetical protein
VFHLRLRLVIIQKDLYQKNVRLVTAAILKSDMQGRNGSTGANGAKCEEIHRGLLDT